MPMGGNICMYAMSAGKKDMVWKMSSRGGGMDYLYFYADREAILVRISDRPNPTVERTAL